MDVTNWGNYVPQSKVPLPHESSFPLKTFDTHRFFAAWADERDAVPTWDPDSIPLDAQFVHRGFDQVVTAKVDEDGRLYLDDWDVHEGEMARVASLIGNCTSPDEDVYAACVLAQAGAVVARLERERDGIQAHVETMRRRLAESFCTGTGRFQSPALRSFEWQGHAVDMLADTANLTVFHLPGFLDAAAADTLVVSAPANGTRHVDLRLSPKLAFDAPLLAREAWAKGFVAAQLGVEEDKEEDKEMLRVFRYNKKEFHAPPCDGYCALLPLPASAYAATLLLYPQAKPQQKTKDRVAWYFTTEEEGGKLGFTSRGDDAVLFLYKTPGVGYAPALLPQLVPCPGTAPEMFVASRWIRRPTGQAGASLVSDEL